MLRLLPRQIWKKVNHLHINMDGKLQEHIIVSEWWPTPGIW